jgi:hypothetical protein
MFCALLKFPAQISKSILFLGTVGLLLVLAASVLGQRRVGAQAEDPPAFHEYRGVQLGMTAEEVRKKLGDPRDKGDDQDFFVFKETETAQILYDKAHKVITISADYLSNANEVPTARQVFGADIEAKPDGSKYKMVRYPKAGYWLSYNRTAGSSPLTTVTLQKIE